MTLVERLVERSTQENWVAWLFMPITAPLLGYYLLRRKKLDEPAFRRKYFLEDKR